MRAIEDYLGGPGCSIVSEGNAAMATFGARPQGMTFDVPHSRCDS